MNIHRITKEGHWDSCMKKHEAEKILAPLCNSLAKILKIWNNMVLKNLTDLNKRKKNIDDILAIENVRLGTIK